MEKFRNEFLIIKMFGWPNCSFDIILPALKQKFIVINGQKKGMYTFLRNNLSTS